MARKRLLVVGAGAKAAAIIARAAVLERLLGKARVPEVIVFEKDQIGAAWNGHAHFSSGFLRLCTPGEKDVGFPYTEVHGRRRQPAVSPLMHACFSWSAYLVDRLAYSAWVDRGRDHPSHRDFADYLAWVFDRADHGPTYGEVIAIHPQADGKYLIATQDARGTNEFVVDGIVLTGTGQARMVKTKGTPRSDHILSAETFWPARDQVRALERGHVAVLGAGGAAGTILAWLAEQFAETENDIFSVSPMGTLFPRGDGYAERRWFSDPSDWTTLSTAHRQEIIDRTEGGVISGRNKASIDASSRIHFTHGRVVEVSPDDDDPDRLSLRIRYGNRYERIAVDYLVSAIGFDTWGMIDLVRLAPRLRDAAMRARAIGALDPDLSLPRSLGYPAGIHFPALGSMLYGPGIGNLSALGDMAERVLRSYLT
jgi:mycobactin lysine-N-oxygenase